MGYEEMSPNSNDSQTDGLAFDRRTVLGLLGAGGVGAATTGTAKGNHEGGEGPTRPWNQDIDAQGHDLFGLHSIEVDHVYTAARKADVIVWKDGEGVFHADSADGTVGSGEDVIEVTQAAVDSLTDGRDWKERVAVVSPSTVGPVEADEDIDDYEPSDAFARIDLPSYTVLDMPARMRVEDEGDQPLVVPVMAQDVEHVEIPNLRAVGNPRFGMFLQSVRNLRLGNISIEMTGSDPRGNIGVRIDGFAHGRGDDTVRCEDVQVDNVYVENSGGHAFETYAVDRIQVGRVLANGVETGCGVLLNDTTDATVGSVIGREIDPGGGYAGFRVANGTHDVTCDQVVVRGGARGVFGVSGSHDITVGEVNISEMDVTGIFVEDNQNFTVQGGVVKNCAAEAVRIHSRNDFDHDPTEGVTISNLRTYDDRPEGEREQSYGIYVSGHQTSNVRIIDCDVRGGGTEQNIRVDEDVSETVLVNNHGGGLDTGTVTLTGGAEPAAVVEGVSPFGYQQPSLRADPVETEAVSFAYDHYFVWNADAEAWDLYLEWKHDPGQDVDVQYVVDSPRAHLGDLFEEDDDDDDDDDPGQEFDHNTDPGIVDSFESGNLDAYEGATDSYEVTGEEPVAHGEYSLKGDDGIGGGTSIISMDGLDRYPAAGTVFSAKIGYTEATPHMGVAFGAQNPDEFYFARVYRPDGDARLQIWSPDGELGEDDIDTLESGVFYELVVDWGENEEISITLTDPDGEEVGSVTGADPTGYTGGGVGTRTTALLDEIRILE